jgi:hypothetical protein
MRQRFTNLYTDICLLLNGYQQPLKARCDAHKTNDENTI